MKSINRRVVVAISVLFALFMILQITQRQSFRKFSSAPIRDYLLNYSQPIHLPLQCIPFSTISGNIPICVHDNPDEYITSFIRKLGTWEKEHSINLQRLLVANPGYGIVDIGSNLGMFSLLAANLQRPSLAVEAMDINIQKIHQSILINHFEEYITVVTRPLSDKYETIQIHIGMNNLGKSRLFEEYRRDQKMFKGKMIYENKMAMMLDDLVDLMVWKKAIMVIDVEGNEGKIMRGGQKFFDAIHISHIFMEWCLLHGNEKKFLVDFFTKRGYEPYDSPFFSKKLNLSDFFHWPADIFWQK